MSDSDYPQSTADLERSLSIIGGKWSLFILYNLCDQKRGFNDLMRAIGGISPRILSLRLKEMVQHGLITKTVLSTTPPQTEYGLTDKGVALRAIILDFANWSKAFSETNPSEHSSEQTE